MSLRSLWQESASLPHFTPLRGEREVDVVVVGAGISGITAAWLLRRAGKRVAVLEARRVGSGETGHTTAHLSALVDARYHVIESKFGREGARLVAESVRGALDRIETWIGELAIDCGFERVPEYLYAETDAQREELRQELASLERAGAPAGWTDDVPLPFATKGALRIERQGRFHPLAYLRGLTAQLVAEGGEIFEGSPVIEVHDGEPCRVQTDEGTVIARDVLLLTNVPAGSKLAIVPKIAAYRSYAIAIPLHTSFPAALFSDMADPYHYVRSQDTELGSFLIVGGEDHKVGQNDDPQACFDRLARYAAEKLGAREPTHRWSGQIIEPADGLPLIGENAGSDHVYVATGFSGEGMTFGTVAALLLCDRVIGRDNPCAELYQATRVKPLAQAARCLKENVDFPAYLARDRLATGDVESAEQVPAGEGRVLRVQGKMLAIYRDDAGVVHARSAVCTHLGCYVRWNRAERSWDCPCHGSRFDPDGVVLNGPANRDLALAELDVEVSEPVLEEPAAS